MKPSRVLFFLCLAHQAPQKNQETDKNPKKAKRKNKDQTPKTTKQKTNPKKTGRQKGRTRTKPPKQPSKRQTPKKKGKKEEQGPNPQKTKKPNKPCKKEEKATMINLYHDYRSFGPFSAKEACVSVYPIFNADSERTSDPRYPLVQALFVLKNNQFGTPLPLLISTAQSLSTFSEDELTQTLLANLKTGLFVQRGPVAMNYCNGCTPYGAGGYVLGTEMDRSVRNQGLVLFLLSLVGGYSGSQFNFFFKNKALANCNKSTSAGTTFRETCPNS